MIIVLTTTADKSEADRIAEGLVNERLAACVQIVAGISSIYLWKGKVTRDEECLLLIKTRPEFYNRVEEFITANHSYDVPEIVAIPSDALSADYAKWLDDSLAGIQE